MTPCDICGAPGDKLSGNHPTPAECFAATRSTIAALEAKVEAALPYVQIARSLKEAGFENVGELKVSDALAAYGATCLEGAREQRAALYEKMRHEWFVAHADRLELRGRIKRAMEALKGEA